MSRSYTPGSPVPVGTVCVHASVSSRAVFYLSLEETNAGSLDGKEVIRSVSVLKERA